jgi:hypothetical protein
LELKVDDLTGSNDDVEYDSRHNNLTPFGEAKHFAKFKSSAQAAA